jgi:hypothetical protein
MEAADRFLVMARSGVISARRDQRHIQIIEKGIKIKIPFSSPSLRGSATPGWRNCRQKRKFQDVLNVAQGEVPGAFATPVYRTPSAVVR